MEQVMEVLKSVQARLAHIDADIHELKLLLPQKRLSVADRKLIDEAEKDRAAHRTMTLQQLDALLSERVGRQHAR